MGAGGKKREIFGPRNLRAPPLGTPPFRARFFWVRTPPFGPHHDTHTHRSKWIGFKNDLAKNRVAFNGLGEGLTKKKVTPPLSKRLNAVQRCAHSDTGACQRASRSSLSAPPTFPLFPAARSFV